MRSGDLAVFAPYERGGLAVVIDGLGHGADAADASAIAERVIRTHASDPPAELMQRCHQALRKSRGVVLTAAWFDLGAMELSWAGVGNVEARLVRGGGDLRRPARVGARARRRRGLQPAAGAPARTDLRPGDAVAFATDGIEADYSASLTPALPAQRLAERILSRHGRATDDALAAVVRYHRALTRRAPTRQFARATACGIILSGIRPRRNERAHAKTDNDPTPHEPVPGGHGDRRPGIRQRPLARRDRTPGRVLPPPAAARLRRDRADHLPRPPDPRPDGEGRRAAEHARRSRCARSRTASATASRPSSRRPSGATSASPRLITAPTALAPTGASRARSRPRPPARPRRSCGGLAALAPRSVSTPVIVRRTTDFASRRAGYREGNEGGAS